MEESKCQSYLQESVIRGSEEVHASQSHFDSCNRIEQHILEAIYKYMKDKKLLGSRGHGFTKGISCSSNVIVFYNEMTSLVDERNAVGVICLDAVPIVFS